MLNANNRLPIVVEFVRHAGSGKTFLKEKLLGQLEDAVDVSLEGRVTLRDLASLSLYRPKVAGLICRMVIGSKPASLKHAVRALFKMCVYQVKMEKALARDVACVVCCEGMLHRLRMLKSGSRRRGLAYSSLAAPVRKTVFGQADLVVFVVASLRTVANRRAARNDGEMENEGPEGMIIRKKESFSVSVYGTETDIIMAQREHGFRYLKIVNEDESELGANLKRIVDAIACVEQAKYGNPKVKQ